MSICVCVLRAVQESPVMKMCMWKALPNSQMCSGIRRYQNT